MVARHSREDEHLIDGRYGPTDEDANVMKQVGQNLPKSAQYVVILTKADKNVKGNLKKKPGKVSVDIIDRQSVREAQSGEMLRLLSHLQRVSLDEMTFGGTSGWRLKLEPETKENRHSLPA